MARNLIDDLALNGFPAIHVKKKKKTEKWLSLDMVAYKDRMYIIHEICYIYWTFP